MLGGLPYGLLRAGRFPFPQNPGINIPVPEDQFHLPARTESRSLHHRRIAVLDECESAGKNPMIGIALQQRRRAGETRLRLLGLPLQSRGKPASRVKPVERLTTALKRQHPRRTVTVRHAP